MPNKIKSLVKKLSKFGYYVKPKTESRYDPVCGMKATSDLIASSHQGRAYYFCSDHCKEQFEANPVNFAN
ncbi:MAG: YHS domain-containing protein [bacterium]|nr:YHS domain-containing protein [bacterium]